MLLMLIGARPSSATPSRTGHGPGIVTASTTATAASAATGGTPTRPRCGNSQPRIASSRPAASAAVTDATTPNADGLPRTSR